jgi:hypothetical protein
MTTQTNLPAKILKEGLPVIRNNQELNNYVHEVFTPDKFNVLVPRTLNFGGATRTKVLLNIVQLDPSTESGGDFWPISGQYVLRSKAVNKISCMANIQWDPEKSGIVDQAYEKGLLVRAEYRAVGTIMTPEGVVRVGSGNYEYNYYADLEDPRFEERKWDPKLKKKIPTGKPDMKQIKQRRRFGKQLAETGAKTRAIFSLLGVLDRSLKEADIHKPFIIPCVVPEIDNDDPEVRRLIAEQAIGAKHAVYGNPVKADYTVDEKPGNGHGGPRPDGADEPAAENKKPDGSNENSDPLDFLNDDRRGEVPQLSPEETREMYWDTWSEATQQERGDKIIELAGRTGHTINPKKHGDPHEWDKARQMTAITTMAEMANEIPGEGGSKHA